MNELGRNSKRAKTKRTFTSQAVGLLLAWGIDRAMRNRQLEKSTRHFDRTISKLESRTLTSLRRMSRNARKNVPLLTSGVAAIAVGVGLLAFAGVRRH